ncbi:MAG: tetratricopeptide repeat protein [Myxococcales bacterium FL481]|nr:MAG: tetratricopeptide repeat protein [Myxococcales bacterium FL481]
MSIARAAEPAAESPEELEAQVKALHHSGATLFETADYQGAIENFTQALKIANSYGADPQVRGALLYNIGKSRMKAYEVSRDASELRQALAIYTRFVDDAKAGAGYTETDVADAEREITSIRALLEEAEADAAALAESIEPEETDAMPGHNDGEPPGEPGDETADVSRRRVGVSLAILGGLGVAGGAGLIGYGATFRGYAEQEINSKAPMPVDPDDYRPDQQEFYDNEVGKGRWLMGGGGALAAAGVALLVVGIVKARRQPSRAPAAELALLPALDWAPAGVRAWSCSLVARF